MEIIKDTTKLQIESLHAFADMLGLDFDDYNNCYTFGKQRISPNTIIKWHNGAFPIRFSASGGMKELAWITAEVLHLTDHDGCMKYGEYADWLLTVTIAYAQRNVKTAKLQYSRRNRKFIVQSHLVKLMEGVTL